jgi:hypothetical protein
MTVDRSMKLKIAAFASIIILLYFSIPLTVITLIIGLLFIPPVAVIVYTFLLGISMIRRELEGVLSSGKDFFLISVSKEYITLEPQFR